MTLLTERFNAPTTTRLDLVVFALRSAPDWARLDVEWSAGRTVDTAAYVPAVPVPHFPGNVPDCIDAWNAMFRVNFFRMRSELSRIAARSRAANRGAAQLASGDLANLLAAPSAEGCRAALFFCDDDDWFCPDLQHRIADLDWSQPAIKVFPLLRLGGDTFTFARRGETCAQVVGRRRDFHFRFQTNNYAVPNHPVLLPVLPELSDHILASAAAERMQLPDEYRDIVVSATNKSPCSASILPQILKDRTAFLAVVEAYVRSLRDLRLPEAAEWCAPLAEESASLFEAALG